MLCPVCEGDGQYPIIDARGRERYSIRCPECYGSGLGDEPVLAPEPSDLPPASTAAKIKTMTEMREHIAEKWSATDGARQDG